MARCGGQLGRKVFFSEEKKQKTFALAVADFAGGTTTCICKVFCFLSSEKKTLLSYIAALIRLHAAPRTQANTQTIAVTKLSCAA
jgi:hypothetical protein